MLSLISQKKEKMRARGSLFVIAFVLLLGSFGSSAWVIPDFVVVGAGNSGCVIAANLSGHYNEKVRLCSLIGFFFPPLVFSMCACSDEWDNCRCCSSARALSETTFRMTRAS